MSWSLCSMQPYLLLLYLSALCNHAKTCTSQDGECSCSGSGECTLDCLADDSCKTGTLTCTAGYTCNIKCNGKASCQDSKLDGSGATSVTVLCLGIDSCKGHNIIDCGSGICNITCEDSTSCENAEINANEATQFICAPTSNCNHANNITAPYIHSTANPTTHLPSKSPTNNPNISPSNHPTKQPSNNPTTNNPTATPTKTPSNSPIITNNPSINPTKLPTLSPIITFNPTNSPTFRPTKSPTPKPTKPPSQASAQIMESTILQTVINSPKSKKNIANNALTLTQYALIIISMFIMFCCIFFIGYLILKNQNKSNKNNFINNKNEKYIPLLKSNISDVDIARGDGNQLQTTHKIAMHTLFNRNDSSVRKTTNSISLSNASRKRSPKNTNLGLEGDNDLNKENEDVNNMNHKNNNNKFEGRYKGNNTEWIEMSEDSEDENDENDNFGNSFKTVGAIINSEIESLINENDNVNDDNNIKKGEFIIHGDDDLTSGIEDLDDDNIDNINSNVNGIADDDNSSDDLDYEIETIQ